METELWFNFLREAGKREARIFLINGRFSEKSVNRYSRIPKTMSRVLHYFTLALMQDAADAKRISGLGIRSKKVKVIGNVKFDQINEKTESLLTEQFREDLRFRKTRR